MAVPSARPRRHRRRQRRISGLIATVAIANATVAATARLSYNSVRPFTRRRRLAGRSHYSRCGRGRVVVL